MTLNKKYPGKDVPAPCLCNMEFIVAEEVFPGR